MMPAKKIGKPVYRSAAGDRWQDKTLGDWPENDYRIFVGDLGTEVSDDHLARAFGKYASFQKARVVKDKTTQKSRGFGFVSFMDSADYSSAMREMNGKYIGNRPCKLKKSDWAQRNDTRAVKNRVVPKKKPYDKRKHIAIGPSIGPPQKR
jgi:RNA recognition motif-containing protein